MAEQFDRAYYQRFYFNPRTAVTNRAEMNARGRLIAAMADHIGLPVRNVLDAGCGVGLLRAPLKRRWPNLGYTGLEVSQYLCRRYGWIHSGIQDFTRKAAGNRQFDIVICYDVLPTMRSSGSWRSSRPQAPGRPAMSSCACHTRSRSCSRAGSRLMRRPAPATSCRSSVSAGAAVCTMRRSAGACGAKVPMPG
jgi:hypothetical protein